MGVIFTQCPFKDELITSSVVTASDYLLYSCDPRDLQPKSQQSKTCCISSCVCRNKMHDIILFSVKIEKKRHSFGIEIHFDDVSSEKVYSDFVIFSQSMHMMLRLLVYTAFHIFLLRK